ncbi:hypothetical protein V3I01_08220 [Sphingomonas sp. gentR]|uniref:hypothetical protein n=1 Tax=Sphingomonas sp. gentR TaxID=3118768 RepID=UPI0030D1FD2B
MTVDHANPYHDAFCRCRACKPPLVGEQTQKTVARLRVATGAAAVAAAIVLGKGLGL